MNNTCILSGDLKIFVHHIYELQKGMRSMVLCTLEKKTKSLLCNVWRNWESPTMSTQSIRNGLICFLGKRNVSA